MLGYLIVKDYQYLVTNVLDSDVQKNSKTLFFYFVSKESYTECFRKICCRRIPD